MISAPFGILHGLSSICRMRERTPSNSVLQEDVMTKKGKRVGISVFKHNSTASAAPCITVLEFNMKQNKKIDAINA